MAAAAQPAVPQDWSLQTALLVFLHRRLARDQAHAIFDDEVLAPLLADGGGLRCRQLGDAENTKILVRGSDHSGRVAEADPLIAERCYNSEVECRFWSAE